MSNLLLRFFLSHLKLKLITKYIGKEKIRRVEWWGNCSNNVKAEVQICLDIEVRSTIHSLPATIAYLILRVPCDMATQLRACKVHIMKRKKNPKI